jgi:hypothetical protein
MSDAIKEAVASLAEFTALARSQVMFDARGEIDYIPAPEGPGRLAKQLCLLAEALAAIRGGERVGIGDYLTLSQVAQDTLPAQRRTMMEVLLASERAALTTTDVATATRYPTNSARRYLQELAAIRLVDRLSEGAGHADRWEISSRLSGLLEAMRAPLADTEVTSSVSRSDVSV